MKSALNPVSKGGEPADAAKDAAARCRQLISARRCGCIYQPFDTTGRVVMRVPGNLKKHEIIAFGWADNWRKSAPEKLRLSRDINACQGRLAERKYARCFSFFP